MDFRDCVVAEFDATAVRRRLSDPLIELGDNTRIRADDVQPAGQPLWR